jgi:hypothetical protein
MMFKKLFRPKRAEVRGELKCLAIHRMMTNEVINLLKPSGNFTYHQV